MEVVHSALVLPFSAGVGEVEVGVEEVGEVGDYGGEILI